MVARIRAVFPRVVLAKVLCVLGAALAVAFAPAAAAFAQVTPNATITPSENTGGWVYGMAVVVGVLGLLIVLLVGFGYMRFAPRFARGSGAERVRADPARMGQPLPRRAVDVSQAAPVIVPPPAVPATVGAPAPAPTPAPAAAAPAAPAPAPAAPPTPATAAPPAAATPAAAPAAAAERPEVSIDQETFDATLEALLAKGTDRRVAEGQARRAAMIAARKKAGG
jgi:hypothetical protein